MMGDMRSVTPALMALSVLVASCDVGTSERATDRSLPSGFKMTGEATLHLIDGGIVECTLDLVFEQREEVLRDATRVVYKGVHGGGMYRSIRAADDSGTTFWLNVYGETEVRLVLPDSLEFDIPINANTGSRFYDNFTALRGTLDATNHGSGEWACAPLDTEQDGHPDRQYTANGTWTVEPFEIEPEPPEDGFMLED